MRVRVTAGVGVKLGVHLTAGSAFGSGSGSGSGSVMVRAAIQRMNSITGPARGSANYLTSELRVRVTVRGGTELGGQG